MEIFEKLNSFAIEIDCKGNVAVSKRNYRTRKHSKSKSAVLKSHKIIKHIFEKNRVTLHNLKNKAHFEFTKWALFKLTNCLIGSCKGILSPVFYFGNLII